MQKTSWYPIINNNFTLETVDTLDALTDELIQYLSSTDAELRDTIAYNILARWIITHQYYDDSQLIQLVERLLPMLHHHLGKENDDSIFGRSYAALVLSLLVYQDDRVNFMTDALARHVLDETRNYLIAERDNRAYVEGKGWANACSHACDLLKFMARNRIIDLENAKRIVDTVAEKVIMQTTYIYHHDEDERLAQVILAVLDLNLLNTYELETWLKHFTDWKDAYPQSDTYNPTYHATYQNIKNFLRSIYIQLQMRGSVPVDVADFEPALFNVLRQYAL